MNRLQQFIDIVQQMVGVPSYTLYLQHMATHHPDTPPMCEKAFHRKAIDEKYNSTSIRRCC